MRKNYRASLTILKRTEEVPFLDQKHFFKNSKHQKTQRVTEVEKFHLVTIWSRLFAVLKT